MMETFQSIQNISCRICRESACRKKVTFELDSIWSSLFEFCLGFQITRSGPLSFCETCSNKLHDYGEFKRLCLKSEEIWKSLTNSFCVQDHSEDKLNIVQEESFEENTGYPDTFDQDDNDYNVILIVKEENDENSAKKLEEKLTEISIKKIENPLVKDEEPTDHTKYEKKIQKAPTKSSKITTRCKYAEKRDKNFKTKPNQKPKSSKNHSDMSMKQEVTDLYCGLCDFTSISSVEVKQHLIRHCQENDLKCQLCSFEGKDVAHLISHRYIHLPQLGRKRECPLCSAVFFAGRKLQFHYRSVHLKTKGGLCIVCGRTYRSYKQWRGHETGHVTRNFICYHCGMSFVQRNQIEDHMVIHTDIFNFICDLCGKAFRKKGNLKSHYYNHHTEHNKVACTICSTKFKHEKYLTRHMQEQHGEKKYLCKLCSKGFCTRHFLREHIYRFHSDERPYACDLCGATFRANLGLKIHQRIHTGELPYTCPECGKGFRSSTACKAHQSVHTGVRPFKCLHCDKMFNCKKRMQAHYNSKHKGALRKGEVKL